MQIHIYLAYKTNDRRMIVVSHKIQET